MSEVPAIDQAIVAMLSGLEGVEAEHDELTDTDVRESIHLVLNYFFVSGKNDRPLPVAYGMFSPEGDAAVSAVVREFLAATRSIRNIDQYPVGQARLDLLQNPKLATPQGRIYDEFIGHTDTPIAQQELPAYLYEPDYDE